MAKYGPGEWSRAAWRSASCSAKGEATAGHAPPAWASRTSARSSSASVQATLPATNPRARTSRATRSSARAASGSTTTVGPRRRASAKLSCCGIPLVIPEGADNGRLLLVGGGLRRRGLDVRRGPHLPLLRRPDAGHSPQRLAGVAEVAGDARRGVRRNLRPGPDGQRALELVGRVAQLPCLRIDQAPVDEDLHGLVLALLGVHLRELQLGQRGVEIELLVEADGGSEVRVRGEVLDGDAAGVLGGSGGGGDQQGEREEEAHPARLAERPRARGKRKWPGGVGPWKGGAVPAKGGRAAS